MIVRSLFLVDKVYIFIALLIIPISTHQLYVWKNVFENKIVPALRITVYFLQVYEIVKYYAVFKCVADRMAMSFVVSTDAHICCLLHNNSTDLKLLAVRIKERHQPRH